MSLPIYQRVAVTDAGDVIPGAEYTVINENTGVAAPIYSDRTGATLLTAPYFADSAGTIQFFIAQGTTFRVAASGGVGTYTDRYIYAAHPQSSATDPTSGSLMAVGAWGLGGLGLVVTDANTALRPGFYCGPGASGVNYFNAASGQYGTLLVEVRQILQIMQTNTFGNRSAKRESLDQGVTWTDWIEIYTTANAVGTVAAGGSGAIIETGSNANGTYTKFADGTMIAAHSKPAGSNINTAFGNIFTTASATWNFPVTFSAVPETSVSEKSGVGFCWGGLGSASISTTSASFTLQRGVPISNTPAATLIAIGRWF